MSCLLRLLLQNIINLDDLNKHLCLAVLEASNSKIKVSADSVSGDHTSSWLTDGDLPDVSSHGGNKKHAGLVLFS